VSATSVDRSLIPTDLRPPIRPAARAARRLVPSARAPGDDGSARQGRDGLASGAAAHRESSPRTRSRPWAASPKYLHQLAVATSAGHERVGRDQRARRGGSQCGAAVPAIARSAGSGSNRRGAADGFMPTRRNQHTGVASGSPVIASASCSHGIHSEQPNSVVHPGSNEPRDVPMVCSVCSDPGIGILRDWVRPRADRGAHAGLGAAPGRKWWMPPGIGS